MRQPISQPLRLWADFNNVMDDGSVLTVLRDVLVPKGDLEGAPVDLYDHEGNFCQGVIRRVQGSTVCVALIESSWVDGHAVSIERRLTLSERIVADMFPPRTRPSRVPEPA